MTIKIKFVIFRGELTALFPEVKADNRGNILSYAAIGQHSAASPTLKDDYSRMVVRFHRNVEADIGLNLIKNNFTIGKLEARERIAKMESLTA